MTMLKEFSTPELVRMLGSRFKEYRMRCGLTQREVSELSGIGLTTIHKFQNYLNLPILSVVTKRRHNESVILKLNRVRYDKDVESYPLG